jgi:XRE family transcriptional regulator, master regulator for biofilm formation
MNKVKELREKQKISQTELASRAGVSRTYLSLIENNKVSNIRLHTMQNISSALRKKTKDVFLL